jgi:hypothetical protein
VIAAWPDADDIERYATMHALDEADIVRDIVRIVSIAHLCRSGFLNEDCVLTGGMGLRLRGSSRFTIKDTDSSLRGPLDELELAGKLNVSVGDELDIRVDPGERWGRSTPKLTIAKPVDYDAYFAATAGDPVSGSFTFTVNQRGLFQPATWLMLVHPYRELMLAEDVRVPVMNLEEQAAEKIVGWAASSLVKHFVDLAWIGREHHDSLDAQALRRVVQKKLDIGHQTYPAAYAALRTLKDLVLPLARPREWRGPLNRDGDNGASAIRFLGTKIGFDEAAALVRRFVVPKLFGGARS